MTAATLRTVRLYGHLAEGIGREIRLAFDSPVRALRLLELNFPGFMQRFREGYYRVVFRLPDGRERPVRQEALDMPTGEGDLVIMPYTRGRQGKRKGVLGVILGAALIGAAFFFAGPAGLGAALPGAAGGTLGLTYGTIAQVGLALALNGVGMLLTPSVQGQAEAEQRNSFVFNGPVNVATPGGPVPLIYGEMVVGTTTVSVDMDNELLMGTTGQKVYDISVQVLTTGDTVEVYLSDMVKTPTGATIDTIDGTPVSVGSQVSIDVLDVTMTDDAAKGQGIVIELAGADNTHKTVSVAVGITHDGITYVSNVSVDVGYPDAAERAVGK